MVVLGGGVGGLTAAHELAERGFDVTVVEPLALGGKARSISVPGTGVGGRKDLPGEHGFRFFPGFYQNVPDTMRRIPFPGNANGVFDNLVAATQEALYLNHGQGALYVGLETNFTGVAQGEQLLLAALSVVKGVPANELEYFVRKLLVYITSCDARRFGEWEFTPWWTFVNAANFSPVYQQVLAEGLTRNLVAAKGTVASTNTIGLMAEAFILTTGASKLGGASKLASGYGAPDRVLNAPTNEAWIDPWVAYLTSLGVKFMMPYGAASLQLEGGRIVSATLFDSSWHLSTIEADQFICAMPVERILPLLSPEILSTDPDLEKLALLQTDWMNGIQFFLNRSEPHPVEGHAAYMYSPWALTSLTQAQFWTGRNISADYGNGAVHDILSVDISDWITPGILYGKPANECTPDEIANEVWAQIKQVVDIQGDTELTDDMLVGWFLDPGINYPDGPSGPAANSTPLLINTVGSWYNRPTATTAISNLYLAADYVQNNITLATMEGANEAARQAVNALLAQTGSSSAPAPLYNLYVPPEFVLEQEIDADRYAAGQPNVLDVGPTGLPL
ncbi:MAG TPA: FAD-dependent oxidoreductase [Acidimicrobiales bacterium]